MYFNLYSALLKIFLKSEMSHFTLLKKSFSLSFLYTILEEDCITNVHTWFNQQSFLSWSMISFCRRNEKVHKSVSLSTKKKDFSFSNCLDWKRMLRQWILNFYPSHLSFLNIQKSSSSPMCYTYTRILKITVIPRHTFQAIVKIDVSG